MKFKVDLIDTYSFDELKYFIKEDHFIDEGWERYTIFQYLIKEKCSDEFINYLKNDNSDDINYQVCLGNNPYHFILDSYYCKNIYCNDLISLLSKKGVDINLIDNDNITPLHFACRWEEKLSTIRLLIDNGADVMKGDDQNLTPFHYFLSSYTIKEEEFESNMQILELFLSKGLIINGLDLSCTPLVIYLWSKNYNNDVINYKLVQFLINNGAHLGTKNENYFIPKEILEKVICLIKEKTLFDLWILDSNIFNSFLQWMPLELFDLLLCFI